MARRLSAGRMGCQTLTRSGTGASVIKRKQRLAKLLARGGEAITYNEHLNHDGALVFEHACRMGLEGIVSKRIGSRYVSGRTRAWLKTKNPAFERLTLPKSGLLRGST